MTVFLAAWAVMLPGPGDPPSGSPAQTAASAQAVTGQQGWSISETGSLIWDGSPYLPVGLRIAGEVEEVKAASEAGVKDVAVELPADGRGWAAVLASLREEKMRYFIVLCSPAPSLSAWVVEPSGYRKSPVTDAQTFRLPLPETPEMLAVTVSRRSGELDKSYRVKADDGIFKVSIDPKGLDQALLLYPHVNRAPYPDYWDSWDAHRDSLLRALKTASLGPGLRGIINPAGAADAFPGDEVTAVPSSRLFQIELEQLLEARYKKVTEALQAWGLRASEFKTFSEISQLVPLWGGGRGASAFYLPSADRILTADPAKSQAWRDIKDVMQEAMHRRTNRLIASIQSLVNVPVLQDFPGWDGPLARSATGLAGAGVQCGPGSLASAVAAVSRPAGLVGSWIKPGIVFGSSLGIDSKSPAPRELVFQTMSLGCRAWFFHAPRALYPLVAKAEDAAASAVSLRRPGFVYYPESAEGGAVTKALPSGRYWVPTPYFGERLYLGRSLDGYRASGPGSPCVALWARHEPVKVRLRTLDPSTLSLETTDGSEPKLVVRGRNVVEFVAGSSPVLLHGIQDLPTPIEAFNEMAGHLTLLYDSFGDRMEDGGQTQSDLSEVMRTFDDQPSASYAKLARIYTRAVPRAAAYIWVDAERISQQNFPDIEALPGASQGRVLSIPARLGAVSATARFTVTPKRRGRHEVWVAGRFPASALGLFSLSLGGTEFHLPAEDMQVYGHGLTWKKLGEIELDTKPHAVSIRAEAPLGTTVWLDAVMITPDAFTPNGPYPPTAWIDALPRGRSPVIAIPEGRDSGGPSSKPPRFAASSPTR